LENPDQPLFNRAISGEYPSGSTIKPVVAAAALQEGLITAGTSFVSSGGIRINEWFFPDWKAGGHGITDVRKAIAQSVNTFFYIIGGGYGDFTGLGPKKLKEYMEKFGLNNKTGIDLPGERVGFVPDPEWKWATKNEQWYIGDTYHVSIGQGDLLVTPLQVANYIAAVANGGTLYRPHLAKKIVDPAVQKDSDILPEVLDSNFVDPKNIQIVREGMRQTVVSGSARSLSNLPIAVAGKTGTAQWGTDKANHAWFTSFAPYENPEISVTILIEEGIEGSTVAVPIARDFYQWWATQIRNKN
jgi:penicillin-binding protein 2